MRSTAALGALLACLALGATARGAAAPARPATARPAAAQQATAPETRGYHFPPGRREIGLRLGAARPFCDCSPAFGPAARLQILWAHSRLFKLGISAGFALFKYSVPNIPGRNTATTSSLRLLIRAYPVMGRRAGLYFDLGVGLAHATMHEAASGIDYSTNSPTLGIGAGVPIVVARWLRLGPYAAALFHVSAWSQSCNMPASGASSAGSGCPGPEPAHSGFVGFGLETTVLFGP